MSPGLQRIEARVKILDEAVRQLMKDKDGYGINLELTTPETLVMGVLVKPDEIFSYNTTISNLLTRVNI
jgi:hypothetical protein